MFDKSCWWSIDDWEGDRDYEDANKLKGLTHAFSLNNHTTAMLAWRPAHKLHTMEVAAYTNDKNGDWMIGPWKTIACGDKGIASCKFDQGVAKYSIILPHHEVDFVTHPFPQCAMMREVGTSIGGADNSPGPYGGKATQAMKLYCDFRVL